MPCEGPVRSKRCLFGPYVATVSVDQDMALHLLAVCRKLDGPVPRVTVRLGIQDLFDEGNTVSEMPDIRTGGTEQDVVSRAPIPHSANTALGMQEAQKNDEHGVRAECEYPHPAAGSWKV